MGQAGRGPLVTIADLGVDLLVLNFVSESPSGTTGSDPSAGLGIVPKANLKWNYAEQHGLEFGFKWKMHATDFSGAGSRVGSAVTDGSVSTNTIAILMGYNYQF